MAPRVLARARAGAQARRLASSVRSCAARTQRRAASDQRAGRARARRRASASAVGVEPRRRGTTAHEPERAPPRARRSSGRSSTRSSARPTPTRRGSVCVPATPGIMPRPVSGSAKRASSRRHAEVAQQRHLHAAADGVAVHGGDGGGAQREQAAPHVAPPAHLARHERRRRAAELAQVAAGRERRARARAARARARRGSASAAPSTAKRSSRIGDVVGVQALGTIERDERRSGPASAQRSVANGLTRATRSPRR